MKTELRLKKHDVLMDQHIVELYYNGEYIGAIYGVDGPGIRIMTRKQINANPVIPFQGNGAVHHMINIFLE